jgi:lysozyme
MTGILNEESGLLNMLKRHEGVRSKVYVCSGGYETIGVGRNISETGLGLDDREINYLLGNDILRVRKELEDEYPWFVRMDSVRQDALIDISFNLGQTVLRKFKNALKAMAKKQYEEAANEFMDSRWSQQVGNRALEVTNMIRSGEYQ